MLSPILTSLQYMYWLKRNRLTTQVLHCHSQLHTHCVWLLLQSQLVPMQELRISAKTAINV